MSEIAPQLDYKKVDYIHPTYRYSKVIQQTGGQTVTITTGGNLDSIFEIPVKAFNLARSYLTFIVTPHAAAAANFSYWFFTDCFSPILTVQLYTRSGIYLCDLTNVTNYTKISWKPDTKLTEFLDYDHQGNTTNYPRTTGRYFCRNNTLVNSATETLILPFGLRHDNTNSNINYTEPKYLEPGTIATTDPIFNVSIPLSAIKNTIFALDKDIYLGEIVLMRLVWNTSPRMSFISQTNAAFNPTTNAAAPIQAMDISNLSLYLAVEKNQALVNELISKVNSGGLGILIPYVYAYKYNSGAATSHSVSYRFNRGHGIRLQKIYHSAFNNTETTNVAYDHSNIGTAKVNQFYTMLDNERQQEINLNTAQNDDYNFLRPLLKGSVIQSTDMFYYNWVWIEDFANKDNKNDPYSDNKSTGLDLSVERKWDFYALQVNNGAAAQYNYYTFAVTEKMLTISTSGITVI